MMMEWATLSLGGMQLCHAYCHLLTELIGGCSWEEEGLVLTGTDGFEVWLLAANQRVESGGREEIRYCITCFQS